MIAALWIVCIISVKVGCCITMTVEFSEDRRSAGSVGCFCVWQVVAWKMVDEIATLRVVLYIRLWLSCCN